MSELIKLFMTMIQKIIISSKYLHQQLVEFGEDVRRTNMEPGRLILIGSTKVLDIDVHIIKFHASLDQSSVRWDRIIETLKITKEQPIVLTMGNNSATIELQF